MLRSISSSDKKMHPLIFMLLLFHQAYTFDYCTLNCQNEKHTACAYQCDKLSNKCGKTPKELQMSNEARKWFLERHNEHRNKVALGEAKLGNGFTMQAADMNTLQYDEELEYIARCWINQCVFGHDSCRATERWKWIGQNAFTLWTTDVNANLLTKENVERSVDSW